MRKITQKQLKKLEKDVKEHIKDYPHIREGQAFFNLLYDVDPEVAESIRATKYDPFHLSNILPKCKEYITEQDNGVGDNN